MSELLVFKLQEVWLDEEDVQLLKEGEEVTLMDWGNAIVQTIAKSADGKSITGTCSNQHSALTNICTSTAITWCLSVPQQTAKHICMLRHLIVCIVTCITIHAPCTFLF